MNSLHIRLMEGVVISSYTLIVFLSIRRTNLSLKIYINIVGPTNHNYEK